MKLVVGLCCVIGLLANSAGATPVRYAFAVNGLDFSLSTFRVGEQGELRHLGHRPMTKSVPFVILDPSGQFVLVPSKTVSTISVFRLNAASGGLTPVPGSPFPAKATSPFSLTFHPSGKFLYAAARFSGVGAYAFDVKTGALTSLPGSPFPAGERTRGIAMHPSGDFLYASNGYSNSVSAYRIDERTGQLTPLSGSPYSVGEMGVIDYRTFGMEDVPEGAGGIPYDVTVDPQGRFAFVANWAAASVSVFRIDARAGQLSAVKGSPFFTGFNPYRLAVHPTKNYLYVTQFSSSEIAVHAFDEKTGKLSMIKGSPFATGGLGPVAVNFSANGRQLYVPNYESNDISLFDVSEKTGALKLHELVKTRSGPWYVATTGEAPGIKKAAPAVLLAEGKAGLSKVMMDAKKTHAEKLIEQTSDALEIAELPGGRFVYVLNRAKAEITTYRFEIESGQLRAVENSVVATGKQPAQMTVDVNDWYLYVTNSGDNSLIVYYLDQQTGLPKRAHKTPSIATGGHPSAVVLDSAARYAFVINAEDNNASVYSYMNSVTPLIFESHGAGSPFPLGKKPVALAIDPTGRFAYAANAGDDTVSAFRIHHQTGALVELPGSPFAVDHQPQSVVAHPNGKWVYVINADSREVLSYRIEGELGALAERRVAAQLPVKAKSMRFNIAGDKAYFISQDGRRLLQYNVGTKDGRLSLLVDKQLSAAVSDLRIME